MTRWMTVGNWKFFTWRTARVIYFINDEDKLELALDAAV